MKINFTILILLRSYVVCNFEAHTTDNIMSNLSYKSCISYISYISYVSYINYIDHVSYNQKSKFSYLPEKMPYTCAKIFLYLTKTKIANMIKTPVLG